MFLQKTEYLVVVGVGDGVELKLTGAANSWSWLEMELAGAV